VRKVLKSTTEQGVVRVLNSQENIFDVIVIGGGMAGVSVAAELAPKCKVALLEMESQPGYHTTGRSAAIFAPTYGPQPIRALTRASEAFFLSPPAGFCDHPLLTPRKIMMIARADQENALMALVSESQTEKPVQRLNAVQTRQAQPLLRDGYADSAMMDDGGFDIDVDALLQGFLRSFRTQGGTLLSRSPVTTLTRDGEMWTVRTGDTTYGAPIVINAAGAWADQVATLAGAQLIGLVPKRRTVLIVPAPADINCDQLPLTADIDEGFYLKPDAGRLLISPANEDPSEPCDAQPDEMDIAICVDRIETAFDLPIRRIENKWAGLRSFVGDKSPVVGFDGKVDGFFWLAGQGGYGIQTAPALSRVAAALVLGQDVPQDVLDQGLISNTISPSRLT